MKNTILACFLFIATCTYAQDASLKTREDNSNKYAGIQPKQADASMIAKTVNPAALKTKPQKIKTADASQTVATPERARKKTNAVLPSPAPTK